jgi:hypothetical protein
MSHSIAIGMRFYSEERADYVVLESQRYAWMPCFVAGALLPKLIWMDVSETFFF